ncbi:pyruvate kinase [Kocuria coralli]|uniref:pyruvate kinase n=1 Tax=Kocuria coralli TaxID=1461025 RepID=UPI001FECAB94|nr:pyruvate kinase [Kocuria coralli]
MTTPSNRPATVGSGKAPDPGQHVAVVHPAADARVRADVARRLNVEVRGLIDHLNAVRRQAAPSIMAVDLPHRPSALNLMDYVAIRGLEIRHLQRGLSALGVSSLGRMEAGVMEHLLQVSATLGAIGGEEGEQGEQPQQVSLGVERGRAAPGAKVLADNADRLLGPVRTNRSTRIMVTLPSAAAGQPELIERYVASGMDVARINCAHDSPREWSRMISSVQAAGSAAGRPVKIAMDLGGPKLRTGPIEPGPRVRKLKPLRDPQGRVTRPARIWLTPAGGSLGDLPADLPGEATAIPVDDAQWLIDRRPGETLALRDARGSRRRLHVVERRDGGMLTEARKTVYLATGLPITAEDGTQALVGTLPSTEQAFRVHQGDHLTLTRDTAPASVRPGDPVRIGCTLPEAFGDAAPGQRVLINDGKISTVIRAIDAEHMELEVTRCKPAGADLKAGKGLNFPDTELGLSALTAEDREHLPFIAEHADMVQLSFARSAEDVSDLLDALEALGATELDVVLKIETVSGFENLPRMLMRLLGRTGCGVMIARGDLAVEAGFERTVELQEEILWLCEAAHVPVIWATQVLETQAHSGLPSRPEVTDAGVGQRAECVMLNKGPFIPGAISTLDSILSRMEGHLSKKSDLLRRLESWDAPVSLPRTGKPADQV